MSDIFREVDEEFKRDQVAQTFKKYSNWIFGALALLVVGVGGYRVYTTNVEKQAAAAGQKFEQALQLAGENKADEARAMLDGLTKDGTGGYKLLARFRVAGDLARTDAAAAVKAFDELAADASIEPVIRDLAKVRAGLLLVDTASFDDLAKRLEPLAAQGQTWRLSAREGLGLSAYRAGDMDKAARYFDQILSDPEATQAGRQRAEIMLSLLRGGVVKSK